MAPDRHSRLRDYECRVAYAPAERTLTEDGLDYIEVHPFADDAETLARLAIQPESCFAVDAYWRTAEDVIFVETITASMSSPERPPGYYAGRCIADPGQARVHVVLDAPCITRVDFEDALRRWQNDVLATDRRARLPRSERLEPVDLGPKSQT